ncbi:MAG: P-type conjugative transfer ATPase TrbB [Fusobacterium necrophorum]|nr:P-type conjugative transfer ATPase TrbB [Fusobacterium necrophorum]
MIDGRTNKMKVSEDRLLEFLEDSLGYENMELLEDDDVIELYVNDDTKIWIDTLSHGREWTGRYMEPMDSMRVIKTVASYTNKIIDIENTIVSAELPGSGSRFQGMIPPNVENPSFNIRKKGIKVFSLDDYILSGSLSVEQKEIILKGIQERKNILIVGATSTGKTTFANAVIAEIAKTKDRLIILEDTREIQSVAEDTLRMKTSQYVNLLKLFESTMRQRPDRIIVGEIRGGEALSLLIAWNSGHPGGLCTIHSETAEKGLSQLEQYVQIVSVSPQEKLIAQSVNLIIVLTRVGGQRKVSEIAEVKGYKDGKYILEYI